MAGPLLTVAFDDASLNAINQFSNFEGYFAPEMAAALQQIGDLLTQAMQNNTWSAFKAPTGQLADSIIAQLNGPSEVIVSVGVSYAMRLEYGFGPGGSAATDSLGRTYHNPPEPYANPALVSSEEQIAQIMDDAITQAFVNMGV